MEIKKMNYGQVAVRLIENTLSESQHVKINGIFLEKNAINEESTHSYYARVIHICENTYNIKEGDVVYLNKVYSRTIVKDEKNKDIIITLFTNIIAKVPDFDIDKFLNYEEMTIIPLGDKCLIEPITNKGEVQYKDIMLMGVGKREQKFAKVLAKGEMVDNLNMGLSVGDYVMMYCDAGTYIKFKERILQLINCCFLICTVDDISTPYTVRLNRE